VTSARLPHNRQKKKEKKEITHTTGSKIPRWSKRKEKTKIKKEATRND